MKTPSCLEPLAWSEELPWASNLLEVCWNLEYPIYDGNVDILVLPLVTILVQTVGLVFVATFLILCSTIWTSSSEDEDDESHSMVGYSPSDESEVSIVITSTCLEGPNLIFLGLGAVGQLLGPALTWVGKFTILLLHSG